MIYIHTHLPKTGGTTLRTMLEEAGLPVMWRKLGEQGKPWDAEPGTWVVGHGAHPRDYTGSEEVLWFVCWRDPIEAMVSYWSIKDRIAAEKGRGGVLPVDEWASSKWKQFFCYLLHPSGECRAAVDELLRLHAYVGFQEDYEGFLQMVERCADINLPRIGYRNQRPATRRECAADLPPERIENLRTLLSQEVAMDRMLRTIFP